MAENNNWITISKIGYCNFKFIKGSIPTDWKVPYDVDQGRGIQFSFQYQWESNTCKIQNIKWEPVKLFFNEETGKRDINNRIWLGKKEATEEQLEDPNFNWINDVEQGPNSGQFNHEVKEHEENCLQIIFNGNSLIDDENCHPHIYEDGPYYYYKSQEGQDPNVYLTPADIEIPFQYSTSSSYITASFKYEYEDEINDDTTVVYYIDIPNIKIPKPSKYENNVVFTEEGVKELVGEVESKVSKSGDIMTGKLNIVTDKGAQSRIVIEHTGIKNNNEQHAKMGIGYINESSAPVEAGKHGLFSYGYGSVGDNTYYEPDDGNIHMSWMIYRNNQGNVIVNGKSTENVLKSGDTMTGPLKMQNAGIKIINDTILDDTGAEDEGNIATTNYGSAISFRTGTDENAISMGYIQPVKVNREETKWQGLLIGARMKKTDGTEKINVLRLGVNNNGDPIVTTNAAAAWRDGISAVDRGGDTMTGNLTIKRQSEASQFIAQTNFEESNETISVSLSTQNNANSDQKYEHGVWSKGGYTINGNIKADAKWMIYRGKDGNIIVNGRSTDNINRTGDDTKTGSLSISNGDLSVSGTLTVSGATTLNNYLILELGKTYGTETQKNNISNPVQGQIFFVEV